MIQSTIAISIGSFIKRYAYYNAWANLKHVNWLKQKEPELFERDIPSSFSSLKTTLLHIWETERFWLSVLQQGPLPKLFRNGFDGALSDIFDGIVLHSDAFAYYVNTLSDEQILENVSLVTPWVEGMRPRFNFIQHCMNHSTYHRGQIVSIDRGLGITDAPMTDYNYFLMMP